MKILSSFLLVSFSFLCVSAYAQQPAPSELATMKKWKISQFDFGLGVDNDNFQNMSLDQLMSMAKNPNEISRSLEGFDEEVETFTGGAALYGNISLSPINLSTGTYRTDRELRLGFGLHSPKEAMVEYVSDAMDSSIIFCGLHGEFTLEAAYLYKGTWGRKFHWYYGFGMNAGTSFANQMLVISGKYYDPEEHEPEAEEGVNITETYKAKSVVYSRLYVPYGVHYALGDHWLVGLDFKTGIGVQFIAGEKANYIRKTGAFILGAKYRL